MAGSDVKPPSKQGARRRRAMTWTVSVVAGLAVLGAFTFGVVFPYTEAPSFCPTCHEMTPYDAAWETGAHRRVSCMDCHVDQGVVNHVLHKFVALGEVYGHFTGAGTFPKAKMPDIPDARCTYCHVAGGLAKAPADTLAGTTFKHGTHAEEVRCRHCHVLTGHAVSDSSLSAAGVLATATAAHLKVVVMPGSAARQAPKGKALAGHKTVVCSACHDMPASKCGACHTSPHKLSGFSECEVCHTPPAAFKDARVDHGRVGTNCAECHQAPADHFGPTCSKCHKPSVPFARTVFSHPPAGEHTYRSFPCAKCHPTGFQTHVCTCHKNGTPGD